MDNDKLFEKLDTLIDLFQQMNDRIKSLEKTVANAAIIEKGAIHGTNKATAAWYIMEKSEGE